MVESHAVIGGRAAWQSKVAARGETVTYRRISDRVPLDSGQLSGGNQDDLTVSAINKRVTRREVNNSGGRLLVDDSSFQVHQDDLGTTEPREGDLIIDAASDTWSALYAEKLIGGTWKVYARK